MWCGHDSGRSLTAECTLLQDADGKQTAVEFIEPPDAAPVGERIGLEGLEMVDPITPAQVKKQKVWEEMVTKVCLPSTLSPVYMHVLAYLSMIHGLRRLCWSFSSPCRRIRSHCSTAKQ